MSEKKRNRKGKVILASGLALLAGSIVATGVILSQVKSSKKIDEPNPGNEPKFEPVIKLTDSKFDELSFEVSNLNAAQNKGKEFIVVLTNKRDFTIRNEKAITIDADSTNIKFNSLESDRKYNLSILFKGKIVLKDVFTTKKRPQISLSGDASSTNAKFVINNINDFKEDLDKIEIVIKNKNNPNSQPIIIKASELDVFNGSSVLDLEKANLGLEPGNEYEATILMKEEGKTTELSKPISIVTPSPKNIAYTSRITNKGILITLYGLKEEEKKILLEYRYFGTSIQHVAKVSENNVQNGKVEILISDDLGFDNKYEFQVKYQDSSDYLAFEDNTTKGEFVTEAAPTIEKGNSNDSEISISKISPNIDQEKLFIRYRDKENLTEWIEKPIKEVPGFSEGKLKLEDLQNDTNYEAQLIYKKEDNSSTSNVILAETEFRTNKQFIFDSSKSIVASRKVLLSFKDGNNSESSDYSNVSLKYVKFGENELKTLSLSKKIIGSDNFAQAVISDLEPSTVYRWMLVSSKDETLFSGTFKTGLSSNIQKYAGNNNFYEDNETDLIAVENKLTDGILISVKNTFGYLTNNDEEKYSPREIQIKYYPKNNVDNFEVQRILISSNEIKNKEIFSKLLQELADETYVIEVSYSNGFDEQNNLLTVSKKFEIDYKLPVITFDNTKNKITITNLESFNGKTLNFNYNDGGDEVQRISGEVLNGQLETNLSNLRPNTNYTLNLELDSNDITFLSSINNWTRSDFFGDELNANKISLSQEFQTADQANSIRVKHIWPSTLTSTYDIYVILEGFKEYVNKNVTVKIGTPDQITSESQDQVKSFSTSIDENGVVDGRVDGQNVRGLSASTDYKIVVYETGESNQLTKIAERDFRTPEIEPARVQRLEIVGSNTDRPGIKIENLEKLKSLLNNNSTTKIRLQKITDSKPFQVFEGNITGPTTIAPGNNDKTFGHLGFTKNDYGSFGNQGDVLYLDNLIGGGDNFRVWFEDRQNYQIIFTVIKDNQEYVVASNIASDLIYFNYSSPKFLDNETLNLLTQKENSEKEFVGKIEYHLNNLWQYVSNATEPQELRAFYIKTTDPLSSLSPTNWLSAGNVNVDDDTQKGTIIFNNLELDTLYNFAFLDKNNNIILSKNRVRTASKPKLKNTTFGDTIMRYTLSDLKGSQLVVPNGTYKIKYSTDLSFNLESNEITIDDSTNLETFEGSFIFTLTNGLIPNTTYNYKLVNTEGDVLLGYSDLFKTNKSQREETEVSNEYAIVKLINPSYKLREGFYSIPKQDLENDNKVILNVLKMQYSTEANFDSYKEFSLSLSENEAEILPIKISGLLPNTNYYYRLVSGTITSNAIKNSGDIENNSEPIEVLDTLNPIISGSFTTLGLNSQVTTSKNDAVISFDKPEWVNETNQLLLRVRKSNIDNNFKFISEYSITSNKVIFNISELNPSTYFEYSLVSNDFNELGRGEFKTKEKENIDARLINLGPDYKRILIRNISDYAGQTLKISYKVKGSNSWTIKNTILTQEDNQFVWDIDELQISNSSEIARNYDFKIELIDSNQKLTLLNQGEFQIEQPYLSSGVNVKTNVRTFGNYDLNNWYTVATLKDLYANDVNWKQKIIKSLSKVAILGSNVAGSEAYAWHELIHENNEKNYATLQSDKVLYEYIFNDRGILKGIKFEFRLYGNQVQVQILGAKRKTESLDANELVTKYSYNDLDVDIEYKSTSGVVNQTNINLVGDFINVSGFIFNSSREKRFSSDFSVSQIFRYNLEETSSPSYNKLTPNTNQVGSFALLNEPKQIFKYKTNDHNLNYDIAYNKYVSKGNKILPVNGNFLISTSYPGFFGNNNISLPLKNDPRNNFINLLREKGKIKFSGSDIKNYDWIEFNSNDILLFDEEEFAISEKYMKEMTAYRLIWKDGNQLKGLRFALSNARNGQGFVLSQFDDFVYSKNYNGESQISWNSFVNTASKHTVHNYMNPNSPAFGISGISFISKDKELINDSYSKYSNFIGDKINPKFILEQTSEETGTRRGVKIINYPTGSYKLKIQFETTIPDQSGEHIFEKEVTINSEESNVLNVDLSTELSRVGTFSISLLNSEEQILNTVHGKNFEENEEGIFVIPDPNNLNSGAATGNRLTSASGWLAFRAREVLGVESNNDPTWKTELNKKLKYGLIGSNKFTSDGTVKRKWGRAIFNGIVENYYENSRMYLFATLSDDGRKLIIAEIVLEPAEGNRTSFLSVASGAKEYILQDSDPKTLEQMTDSWIKEIFNSGSKPNRTNLGMTRVLNSAGDDNKTAILGLYFKKISNT